MSTKFLFYGRLISGPESYAWIKDALINLNDRASICSAYVKLSILKEISSSTSAKNIRFLARWDLNDLVGGASDIECYKYAKEKGWSFYINTRLHAKIYYIPPSGILSGSANATNSGLGLSATYNQEASTLIEPSMHNISFIDNLFVNSTLLNDQLYDEIFQVYKSVAKLKNFVYWPDAIYDKLNPKVSVDSKFFVSECFLSDGNDIINNSRASSDESIHDLSILGIPINFFDKEYISKKFIYSKLFLWVRSLLLKYDGEIYFGTLTQELHNALIEDPLPYRSEVKVMVKNIYSWIENVGSKETKMICDKPNISQRIRLV